MYREGLGARGGEPSSLRPLTDGRNSIVKAIDHRDRGLAHGLVRISPGDGAKLRIDEDRHTVQVCPAVLRPCRGSLREMRAAYD